MGEREGTGLAIVTRTMESPLGSVLSEDLQSGTPTIRNNAPTGTSTVCAGEFVAPGPLMRISDHREHLDR